MDDLTDIEHPERARKVILHASEGAKDRLGPFVEQWVRDRISWVAVVGVDCRLVEDCIDELVVAGGLDRSRFIMTTAHPDETLEEVTEFMLSLVGEYEGDVAIVEV